VTYHYDQRGRVTAEQKTIDSVAYTTSYTYRADDRVRTQTYPDNGGGNHGVRCRGAAQRLWQ